jgi:HEAT repeats
MAIAAKCPQCGKRFKVPESLAGKKGKCSECGGVFRVPTPPAPSQPKVDLDVYGLEEDAEKQAAAGAVASEPAGKAPLEAGAHLASMTIEECSGSRLVLACRLERLLLLVLVGVAALIGGYVMMRALEALIDGSNEPRRIHKLFVMVPLGLMGIGAGSFCYLSRIGYRLVFDRDARGLSVQRLYAFTRSWRVEDLGGVVFRVAKPWSEDEDYAGNKQTADAFIFDRSGRAVALLDRVSINKSKYIVPLARACLQVGRLLRVPVYVELNGPPIRAEMRRAVEMIQKSGSQNSSRPAPKFRAPLVTAFTAATLVGSVVILFLGGRFIVERSVDFHNVMGWFGFQFGPDQPAPGAPPLVAPQLGAPGQAPPKPGAMAEIKIIDELINDMRSPDPQKRRVAAFHLGGRGVLPERRDLVCELLRNMADSADEDDRYQALIALGRWGTDADLQTLITELDGPQNRLREAAAQGLAESKKPRAAEALVKRLHTPDRRLSMTHYLRQFGPAAEATVARLLDDPDDALKLTAASILENIGTRDSLAALQAAQARLPKPGPPPADPFSDEAQRARTARELSDSLDRAARNASTREGAKPSTP